MREDLKQRLYTTALRRASASNFKFSAITNTDLVEFINVGVDKMTASDYASETRKQEAENNLIQLIDAMSNNGKERRLTESLDYETFKSAKSSICPLWPFC